MGNQNGFEGEERKRWNCPPDNCALGHECCAAYIVYDRMKGVTELPKECKGGAKAMVKSAMPSALRQIQTKCEPDFKYNSEKCRALESKLNPSDGNPPTGNPSVTDMKPNVPSPVQTKPPEKQQGQEPPKPPKPPSDDLKESTTPRNNGIGREMSFAVGLLSVFVLQFI